MSSLVIFDRNGITAEWNKEAPYTVRGHNLPVLTYPTRLEALRAAAHLAMDYEPSPNIHDTIELARAFGEEVQAAFTPTEFRAMVDMNKSSHADRGICATHDFCDANMLMLDAFKKTFGREPWFLTDADSDKGQTDMRLWGDAWAITKAADFFA
jgi:hypothetical protein